MIEVVTKKDLLKHVVWCNFYIILLFKKKIYTYILLNDKLVKSCYNSANIDYNFYIIFAKA